MFSTSFWLVSQGLRSRDWNQHKEESQLSNFKQRTLELFAEQIKQHEDKLMLEMLSETMLPAAYFDGETSRSYASKKRR